MSYQAKVTAGRLVEFPEELAHELDLASGNALVIEREDGKLVIKTYAQVVREVQAEFRRLRGPSSGESIVDELIAERRAEAQRENDELDRWLASRA